MQFCWYIVVPSRGIPMLRVLTYREAIKGTKEGTNAKNRFIIEMIIYVYTNVD